MLPQIIIALATLLVIGLALLAFGFRGRRINDRPLCRACRFDLSGSPPGAPRCPECGTLLNAPRAVRIGERRRRPAAIATGLLACTPPLIFFAFAGYALSTGSDLNTFKPLGLLLWEAHRADAATTDRIAQELHRRALDQEYTPEQYQRVIEAVLEYQANHARPWSESWGDIIEQARTDGVIRADQDERFRVQAPVLQWQLRNRVRIGDPIPVLVTVQEQRIGSSTSLSAQTAFRDASVSNEPVRRSVHLGRSAGGPPTMHMNLGPTGRFVMAGSAAIAWSRDEAAARFAISLPRDIEPGQHEVAIEIGIDSTRGTESLVLGPHHPGLVPLHWQGTIEVLPRDAQVIELIEPTEARARELHAALTPRSTQVQHVRSSTLVTQTFGQPEDPPPFAFDVYWRDPQHRAEPGTNEPPQEARLGSITSGEDTSSILGVMPANNELLGVAPSFAGQRVDVILRPSRAAAARTVDLYQIYGSDIVFEDVEIEWKGEPQPERDGFFRRLFGG